MLLKDLVRAALDTVALMAMRAAFFTAGAVAFKSKLGRCHTFVITKAEGVFGK